MLKIYAAKWCPHCRAAVSFLEKNSIPYEYIDMDSASAEVEAKLDSVNGGEWVIPTLEYEGKWIPGKAYSEPVFRRDLENLGLLS